MPSPLFNALGRTGGQQNNPMNMIQAFMKFKNEFQGNAKDECMKIINSGQLSPDQIQKYRSMADQIQNMIGKRRN